jgi:hypothetical protein
MGEEDNGRHVQAYVAADPNVADTEADHELVKACTLRPGWWTPTPPRPSSGAPTKGKLTRLGDSAACCSWGDTKEHR